MIGLKDGIKVGFIPQEKPLTEMTDEEFETYFHTGWPLDEVKEVLEECLWMLGGQLKNDDGWRPMASRLGPKLEKMLGHPYERGPLG